MSGEASDADFTVFIVDDDPAVLRGLARLLAAARYRTRTFASPAEFLVQHAPAEPGCAVFDVSMPDLDGLALQQLLFDAGIERPIIFVTGKGDVPTSVRAMKAGAVDFLTKPVSAEALLEAVERARRLDAQARQTRDETTSIEARLARLTPREREVFTHVVAGRLNKQIAGDLGTVEKTIKVHRGRMMSKLGVRTVQDLVRFAERAGIRPHAAAGRSGHA
jgi:FixJ family two-component response regulator